MDLHTRWFRRLLKLFPADFQADYARDMERTFRAQHRDAACERGPRGVVALWFDTLRDLLRTAPREHAAQFRQDAGYALRMMRRTPGFTCVATATLALGIGANSAIFSVVDAVLLRPLPYPGSERIVRIHERYVEAGLLRNSASPPNVIDWQQQSDAFTAIAAYRPRSINVSGKGEPRYAQASRVTREFFRVLGVAPAIGRSFSLEEDRTGAKVVVLGHELWQAQFGGDAAAIGQAIDLDGEAFEVIGVMPAGFGFQLSAQLLKFQRAAELWMPLSLYPNPRLPGRGAHNLSVIARLRDGVSVSEAQVQMSAIASRLALQYPQTNKGWDVYVEPLHESIVHEVRTIALIFTGAIGFVLLIACANIGGLLVARASARGREFALRLAIGANRTRLARQLLTESLLLAVAGGALGLALAAAGIAVVRGAELPVPRLDQVTLDARALLATAGVSLIAGLLFGMAPVWHVGRWELHQSMSDGGRGGFGRERRRLRAALSAAQVAIALVLLAGAGVMVRTLWQLNRIDPGFRSEGVLAVDLTLSDARYPETSDALRFLHDVVDAAGMVAGVRSAALVSDPPLTGGVGYSSNAFTIVGRPPRPAGQDDFAYVRWVTPRYFETLGIPLLRGRMLAEGDVLDRPGVVLVNAAFAERFFPMEDALGQRVVIQMSNNAPREIVGIVANLRQTSLTDPAEPQIYLSYYQGGLVGWGTLLVRTTGDPLSLAAEIERAVRRVDRQQPLFNVRRLEDIVAASVAAERLTMRALALFAGVALVLSLLGVYGVIAYAVRQRTHEIGVRMALGATRAAVLRLIVGDGIRLATIGAAGGVAGALALTRLLADLVYGVSPSDPGTLAAVVAILLLAAAGASLVPAWRATRIDPSAALRSE